MSKEKEEKANDLDRISTQHKKRDLLILQLLAEGYQRSEALAVASREFPDQKITEESRISQIATANRELLNELTHKSEYATKAGRIRLANQEIRKQHKDKSKEDKLKWIEHIRKEQEGEGGGFPQVIKLELGIRTPFTKLKEETK